MLFFSSEPSRRTRTQIRNEEGLHYDVRLLCRTEGQPLDEKINSFIDDDKSGFILEIIDGRELPEYMTMNKGKICG